MTMNRPGARPAPLSKLGPNLSTNRNEGSVQAPSPTVAGAELAIEVYTFFARPPTDGQVPIIYNGDRQAARIILTLETAGPVAVSNKQSILPVLSGKAQLLETGVPLAFEVSKGNRLYVATSSLNRVKVTVEPILWAEQITGLIGLVVKQVSALVDRLGALLRK